MDAKAPLSPRQIEIVRLAAAGRTDAEISPRLGISLGTLRSHWDRMRARCQVSSRGAIISLVCRDAEQSLEDEVEVLHRVLCAARTLVWTVRADGFVDYRNEWFLEFSGRSPEACAEPESKPPVPEEELANATDRWRVAQSQTDGHPREVLLRDGEGVLVRHLFRLVPYEVEDGAVVRWLGTAHPLPRPEAEDPTGASRRLERPSTG